MHAPFTLLYPFLHVQIAERPFGEQFSLSEHACRSGVQGSETILHPHFDSYTRLLKNHARTILLLQTTTYVVWKPRIRRVAPAVHELTFSIIDSAVAAVLAYAVRY